MICHANNVTHIYKRGAVDRPKCKCLVESQREWGGHQSVVTVTKHSEFKLFIASPDDERLSASVYLRDYGTVLL